MTSDLQETGSRIASLTGEVDVLLVHALAARVRTLSTSLDERLGRVERALHARDSLLALRIADEEPPLPTLVRALEPALGAAWQARCTAAGIDCPRLPMHRARTLLNVLTSRTPHEDDPVPSAYRRAMRAGSAEEALHNLRLWCLTQPDDADLLAQRTHLESQVAAGWLSQLASAPSDDADATLLERVAALPRPVVEALQGWERAAGLFASHLERTRKRTVDALASAVESRENASAAAALAGEWLLLATRTPAPEAALNQRAEPLVARARELLSETRTREAVAHRVETLARDLPSAGAAYAEEELDALASELERLASGLPEGPATKARSLSATARGIASNRRWSARRRKAARGLVAGASIGLIATLGFMLAKRIDLSNTSASTTAEPGATAPARPTESQPAPQQPVAQPANPPEVDAFFARAREAEQELTQSPSIRGAERAEARLAELAQLAATLPPARQREADARLSVLRSSLSSWRADLQDAARQSLSAAEAIRRAEFGPGATPESLRRGLDRLQPLLDSISETTASTAVGLPQLVQAQAAALVREVRATAERLEAFEQALVSWSRAASDTDHRRALAALAASGFNEDPRVRAAAQLSQALPAQASLVAAAFAGADAEAWKVAASHEGAPFSGGSVVSRPLLELVADPVMRDVHQYVLVSRSEGAVPTPVVIHTAGPMVSEEFVVGTETRTRQAVRVLTAEGVVEREFLSRVTPEGQRRGENLELGFRTPEAALVEQLAQRVDAAQGVFLQSPLGFLETLVNDEQASPVFKAYLVLMLAPALEAAPVQTGYAFSPGARELVGAIRQVSGGSIRPTSWVEPAFRGLSAQLAREFRSAAPAVFVEEGRVLAGIFARLSSERFEYAGSADAAGAPTNTKVAVETQLWGFTGERMRFERVYRPGQPPANPLSPLYTLSTDPAAIVRELLAKANLPDAAAARLRRQLESAR